jgi:hypothetical protein
MEKSLCTLALVGALVGCKFDTAADPPVPAPQTAPMQAEQRFTAIPTSTFAGAWEIDRETGDVWECYPQAAGPVCVKATKIGGP